MQSQQRYALIALMLAGFITIFDLFVVNVAMISIQQNLSANFTEITLVLVIYELAFGVLLITGGRLGDLYGRRRLYQIGMFCFIMTSIFCAIAPTPLFLIIARFLQGLTSALLFPQVYASIRSNFNAQEAQKAFASLGMSLGLAAIAGQVLGGFLIDWNLFNLGWRTIFLINAPIGIIAILCSRYLQDGQLNKQLSLDLYGVGISGVGICLFLLPIILLPIWGWSIYSTFLLTAGIATLYLFIQHEQRYMMQQRTPLFDLTLLTNRPFLLGASAVLCIYSTSSAFPMSIAFFYQLSFKLTPFQSGLLFMPASIGFMVSSLLTPSWQSRFGNKILFLGALLYLSSYVILVLLNLYFPMAVSPYLLIPIMIMIGFTQGMIMTPVLNWTLSFIQINLIGVAAGLTATLQQIGAAIGAAIVSTIMQISLKNSVNISTLSQFQTAFSYSLLFNIIIMCIASVIIFKLIHRTNTASDLSS